MHCKAARLLRQQLVCSAPVDTESTLASVSDQLRLETSRQTEGPTHQPTHLVTLRLAHLESGSTLECSGNGPRKEAAHDAAAEMALDAVEPDWRALRPATTEREVHRAEALVGDAVLDLLLALLARGRGLQVRSIDALRRRTLSNYARGGGTAGTACATAVEAVVGRAALQCSLEQVLRDSLVGAGQGALLHAIEDTLEQEAIEPEAVSQLDVVEPPSAILPLVFSFLRIDDLARCELVCQSWRNCLRDPLHWVQRGAVLSFPVFEDRRCNMAASMVASVSSRTAGILTSLDVRNLDISFDLLRWVVLQNSQTLRKLHFGYMPGGLDPFGAHRSLGEHDVGYWPRPEPTETQVEELLAAAPELTSVVLDTFFCHATEVPRFLTNALLQIRDLVIDFCTDDDEPELLLQQAFDALPMHHSIRALRFWQAPLRTELNTLLHTVVPQMMQLSALHLDVCGLTHEWEPLIEHFLGSVAAGFVLYVNGEQVVIDETGALVEELIRDETYMERFENSDNDGITEWTKD